MTKYADPLDRIFSRINIAPNGCWEYNQYKNPAGYGRVHYKGANTPCHRVVLLETIGSVDGKNYACHKCDNPSCVNPEHLFWGTQKDNMQDCSSKGRLGVHKDLSRQNVIIFKLTSEDITSICAIKNAHPQITYRELGEKFGISTEHAWRIANGWKHKIKNHRA